MAYESTDRRRVTENTVIAETIEAPVVKKTLRPLGARVLVKVKVVTETKVGDLYIPDTAVEKPLEGEVVAVGNGTVVNGERIPVDAKVGQVVVFGKYSGNEVEINSQKLLLLQESELQGVYE
jgi:chaperonin GroES